MRCFPRTAGRRVAAATAAAALAVTVVTAPDAVEVRLAAADDDLRDKKSRVQAKIDEAASEFQHSSRRAARAAAAVDVAQASLATAQGRLSTAEGRLTAARARDRQVQEQLELAVARLREATRAVNAAHRRLDTQADDVADVISDIYREGDPALLAFASFLDAEDPADLTRRVEARRVLVGEETRAYDDLRAAEVLLVVEEDQVEAYRDEVQLRREEAAAHLEEMEALRARAVVARREVRRLLRERYEARASARAARRADRQVLAELRSERQRIETLLARRAAAARARAPRTPVRSGGGYLSAPSGGYVSSPYGYRTHPIYGYYSLHDGTDFAAACGSPLYAAAPGQVVSSYYQTAYGNRLIVDHGAVRGVGLASIYNHATSYTVGPGQRVSRGQVIGYVGSTGWSTGCHLHYSVLVNGRTVDPVGWL